MTSTSKNDLRSSFSSFFFDRAIPRQFVTCFNKEKQYINSFMHEHHLQAKREDGNLHEKDYLTLNGRRYTEGFKMAKNTSQPEHMYRRIDIPFHIIGLTLNCDAFLTTIELLGKESQVKKWRKLVLNGEIFGGYGQTQLGHGSNVQGLQTQAHYDEKTKVFVMNSPKVTSAKFWPGVLGLSSTHCVIQAKTFVKGKSIGIQTFVVELRNQKLQDLEGVEAGDIGPKLGFTQVDNGYLLMNNVKVPLENMLMKYIEVKENGEVFGLQNKAAIKYAYGSMLNLRVQLTDSFSIFYMVVPALNLQALFQSLKVDKQEQNRKFITECLCNGLGISIANMYTRSLFEKFKKHIDEKNFPEADKNLAICHITSATFKAVSSWKSLETVSQMMTKNQFSVFKTTFLPSHFINAVPSVTYEGDNSVLLQQTGKFLLMTGGSEEPNKPATKIKDNDMPTIYNVLKYVCFKEVERLKKVFEKEFEGGQKMKTIWNEKHQRDIINIAKLWGNMMFAKGYLFSLKLIKEHGDLLDKIGKVFAKKLLEDCPQVYFYGFEVETSDSWREFTEDEFWALSHLKKSINEGEIEGHKIVERKGDWIRAKL